MAQYPSPYPSQYPPPPPGGYPAPQQSGGYAPPPMSGGYPAPQQPGGYAPPQMPGGYPAPQAPVYPPPMSGGYPAPQQPGGYAPPQMPGGYPVPQQPGGYPAPQQPGGYTPPQIPGSYQTLPVPPAIAQHVATYQLGTLAQVHKANLARLLLFAGVLLVVTFIDIPEAMSGSLGVLSLLILLAASAYSIYYLATNYNLSAYVFTEGLVRARGSHVDVMRWEHVESVKERIVRYRRGFITVYTAYNYTVRRSDGAQFKFDNALRDIKLLGESIQQEVTRHHLPKAIAAYDSGAPVNFGTISVSTQGISRGGVLTPWNQVGQVNFRRGWLIVNKQGSLLAAIRTSASSVPNLPVFLQLVEHGRRRATGGY